MEQHIEELRQKQRKLTLVLGDKIYRLYRAQAIRFLYTSDGVVEEDEVNKLIRLLDYLDERIQKLEEIYRTDDESANEEEEIVEEEKEGIRN